MAKDPWQAVLEALEERLDTQTSNTWFRPTTLATRDASGLTVAVPNEVFRDWLSDNYSALIADVLTKLYEAPSPVRFVVARDGTPTSTSKTNKMEISPPATPAIGSLDRPAALNPRFWWLRRWFLEPVRQCRSARRC